jgi:hypothetical protein
MVKVSILGQMENTMRGNGILDRSMGLENGKEKMEKAMLGIGLKEKPMESVHTFGKMGTPTKEDGSNASNMGMAKMSMQMGTAM